MASRMREFDSLRLHHFSSKLTDNTQVYDMIPAEVAELAFARVSKTREGNLVWVRLPPSAYSYYENSPKTASICRDGLSWTPELAYAVGLIATDGNLSSDGRHISLTSSDIQQIENFKKCLGTKANPCRNPPGSFTKSQSYRIQAGNKILYQQLRNIGLSPNKTGSLGALDIPNNFFRDFLRGVIDRDGSIILYTDRYNVYKGTRYEYLRMYVTVTSASLPFLEWILAAVRKALSVRGYIVGELPRPPFVMPIWKLRFAKQASIRIARWIYYSPDVPCLTRKRVLAERALQTFETFQDKRTKTRRHSNGWI